MITYRKGKVKKLPAARFTAKRQKIDGVWRKYTLCDRPRVRVGALPVEKKRKGKKAKGASGTCGCGRCGCCAMTDARRRSSPTARTFPR